MRKLNLTHEQQVHLIALFLKSKIDDLAPGKEIEELAWLGITTDDKELLKEIFEGVDELIDAENEEREYNSTQNL